MYKISDDDMSEWRRSKHHVIYKVSTSLHVVEALDVNSAKRNESLLTETGRAVQRPGPTKYPRTLNLGSTVLYTLAAIYLNLFHPVVYDR